MLALLLPLAVARAEDEPVTRWYDVELIVIQNLDFERGNTETWPETGRVPSYSQALDLFAEQTPEAETNDAVVVSPLNEPIATHGIDYPEPFSVLEESDQGLQGAVGSLRRSRNFRPLLHLSWTQPPLDRDNAQAVRVFIPSEEDSTESGGNENTTGNQASAEPQEPVVNAEFLPEELFDPARINLARPVDGTATLVVSRYLHLYLDLVFLPENDFVRVQLDDSVSRDELLRQVANEEISVDEARARLAESRRPEFYGFRLDQSRRMRSGEVHYFDHPAFSVIARITPRDFELPEPPPTNTVGQALQQPNQ